MTLFVCLKVGMPKKVTLVFNYLIKINKLCG